MDRWNKLLLFKFRRFKPLSILIIKHKRCANFAHRLLFQGIGKKLRSFLPIP